VISDYQLLFATTAAGGLVPLESRCTSPVSSPKVKGNATPVIGAAVVVDSNGQLGNLGSSLRFKDEIKPMDRASEAIFALRPMT
jgi:hypothetical protein